MIFWDPIKSKFVNDRGRAVPRDTLFLGLSDLVDANRDRYRKLADQLMKGEITINEWRLLMRQEIKAAHLQSGAIAWGGLEQLDDRALDIIEEGIAEDLYYLDNLTYQLQTGQQPMTGRFTARVDLYAKATRSAYFYNEQRRQIELQERPAVPDAKTERSIVGGVVLGRRRRTVKESCPGCIQEADAGWMRADEVAPIGTQECLDNCLCFIEYKTVPAELVTREVAA